MDLTVNYVFPNNYNILGVCISGLKRDGLHEPPRVVKTKGMV
jgi:hypothetical protein